MNKITLGILGCANVVSKRAIPALKKMNLVDEIFIASRSKEKAKKWAFTHEINYEDSYVALLLNPTINTVYIPLPIGLHEKWVLQAARVGKHIICEKSLTSDYNSAKKMISFCQENNLVLHENFMCDFHPQHEKVIDLISKNQPGIPFIFNGNFGFKYSNKSSFRFQKELGGGALNDAGAYVVFMARKIFGCEPISVFCKLFYEDAVDVRGTATLFFPNKKVAYISFSFCDVYQNNYSVWCSNAFITVNPAYTVSPVYESKINLLKNDGKKNTLEIFKIPKVDQFQLAFENFAYAVLNHRTTYSGMLNQAKVLEAMRISNSHNKEIVLEEL